MLPKAGSVLVKIDSIPNTYGTDLSPAGYDQIRWIPTEQDALQLIGSDWNQYIIDLPVFVFRLYEEGERLTPDTRGVWSAGPLRKRASLIL